MVSQHTAKWLFICGFVVIQRYDFMLVSFTQKSTVHSFALTWLANDTIAAYWEVLSCAVKGSVGCQLLQSSNERKAKAEAYAVQDSSMPSTAEWTPTLIYCISLLASSSLLHQRDASCIHNASRLRSTRFGILLPMCHLFRIPQDQQPLCKLL